VLVRSDWRGGRRGKKHDGTVGDCIDCMACVKVCPLGSDIRDGQQMECITCALCIDACDEIMDKIGNPRGLIEYDTPANMDRRIAGEKEQINIFRPRTVIYMGVLVLVSAIMFFSLATRGSIDLNVLRDRNPLFVQLSDGSIRNGYTIKIINKVHEEQGFTVRIDGLPSAQLIQQGVSAGENVKVALAPDSLKEFKTFVVLPRDALSALDDGEASVRFIVENTQTGESVSNRTSFRGPR